MPRNQFTISEIGPELVATDKRIRAAAIRGLRQAARLGRTEVVKEIRGNKPFPLVDLGELMRSPKVEDEETGALLIVLAKHGVFQEYGTGPAAGNAAFTPPFEVIREWARRKKRRSATKRKGKGGRTSAKKRQQGISSEVGELLDESARWLKASRQHLAAARNMLKTPEQRAQQKASRKAAKEKREALADKAADAFAGAVWSRMRQAGMKGKGYYARASKAFPKHVEERVRAQVDKVDY